MQDYENHSIQELPLSAPFFRTQVVNFLSENGLRLEDVDSYFTLQDSNGRIMAGAGLKADVIKCVAVAPEARSEGLSAPLISHLISVAALRGVNNLKVFTKPANLPLFRSLGFKELASAPDAVFMENGRGLEKYCETLRSLRRPGKCGVIVMNANPFTLGHKYLVSKALDSVDTLFVIPVAEDLSLFSYSERLAMTEAGIREFGGRVVLVPGSSYCISAATFPTYFLKDLSSASMNQMALDLDLFARHIAPALGASLRFVGSEPSDRLTARYNGLMKKALPTMVIPRLKGSDGRFVRATRVRALLEEGRYRRASELTPASTRPYLLAFLAHRALRLELDAPLKPGLVCPGSSGAHSDMDYGTMLRGIQALRPFWPRMALAATADELRLLGIEAEKAMMAVTDGVNTHRGAIFALGLALNAGYGQGYLPGNQIVMQKRLAEIAQAIIDKQLKDRKLSKSALSKSAARAIALEGYMPLFRDWLPYFRSLKGDSLALQKTLLRIMASLEDSCVLHRAGAAKALELRKAAGETSADEKALARLCSLCEAEGISPGGAADMLSLTIFIDSILK